MERIFRPFEVLHRIDRGLINALSESQLKVLLLLVASAVKNGGKGKLERETIESFADICFNGEDLFIVCQNLKRFGLGKLTCCNQKNPGISPCLGENWKDLSIGISFSNFSRKRKKK
ncbi:MAG: hypothetical protein PHW62_03740 [Candidatus Ratteibacteria bacterium]|nr:hypothetical protein [Candidatus Ratteibacteria bacterium]